MAPLVLHRVPHPVPPLSLPLAPTLKTLSGLVPRPHRGRDDSMRHSWTRSAAVVPSLHPNPSPHIRALSLTTSPSCSRPRHRSHSHNHSRNRNRNHPHPHPHRNTRLRLTRNSTNSLPLPTRGSMSASAPSLALLRAYPRLSCTSSGTARSLPHRKYRVHTLPSRARNPKRRGERRRLLRESGQQRRGRGLRGSG